MKTVPKAARYELLEAWTPKIKCQGVNKGRGRVGRMLAYRVLQAGGIFKFAGAQVATSLARMVAQCLDSAIEGELGAM